MDALPAATYELCGDSGIRVAVGFHPNALVYRGVFDKKMNRGNWAFSYHKEDGKDLIDAPFDIDYACKIALLKINAFIASFPDR